MIFSIHYLCTIGQVLCNIISTNEICNKNSMDYRETKGKSPMKRARLTAVARLRWW